MIKKLLVLAAAAAMAVGLTACESDARVASRNLAKAAEQFELDHRIVFLNGITDRYLLTIEGRCSIEVQGRQRQLEVTCKVGEDANGISMVKKHHLGLSDNVSYFSEQLDGHGVNVFHYRVIFKPETIIPDIDLVTSG